MPYKLERQPHLDKIFRKLAKKDPVQFEALQKKVKQILENPHKFKHLINLMKGIYRVHIYSSFILTFSIRENDKIVVLEDYDHHDNICQNKK